MATIKSLVESFGVLRENPIVFAVGVLYAVVVLPQTVVGAIGIPLVPRLIQMVTFFVTPFIVAGLLAMVYEGRVRDTSLETFKRIGKDRYVPVLLGNLIEFGFSFAFGIVVFVVAFFVGIGTIMAAGGIEEPSSALLGGLGVVVVAVLAVVTLVYLCIGLLIDFYAVSIVVDDVDVLAGFRNSVGVVLDNPIPALGYGALKLVIALVLLVPQFLITLGPTLSQMLVSTELGGATTAGSAMLGSLLLTALAIAAYTLVVKTLLLPFKLAFAVSFYDNHTE